MSTEMPGTPRAGKYCPRCQTMTQREQPVCRQCGHQFRSGVGVAGSETPPPDPMNRTMQFVLPPLPARTPEPAGRKERLGTLTAPGAGPRRLLATAISVVLVAAACLGAAWYWQHSRRAPAVSEDSPAGVWETVLHGSRAADARLAFVFDPGGGGAFSWRESGVPPHAGQTPLRWRRNPDGTLLLALTPPAGGDPVGQTLTGIFSRPAWTWRVNRAQRRLVLGTLVFTEKR